MSAIDQTRKLDELIVVSDSDERDFQKDMDLCKGKCLFLRDRYTRNYAGNLNTAIDNIVLRHMIHNDENADDIYIAFLDDDDSWKSNYIESCYFKLSSKPDFVVAGLNYSSEGKVFPLSLPTSLEKTSFLAKNPHIQGSNTFIKLSTLLKAGCFDEALNSTTDRDFFTRVMMLNPKYEIINETLVDIDAHNDRSRLTNDNEGKRESLSYFYSKYEGLMDSEIKLKFFERANRYTEFSEESITDNLPHESGKACIRQNCSGFNKHVVFGFIMSDEKLGLRLLKSISDLEGINKSIVLLCNIEYPTKQFIDIAKEVNAKIVLLREAKEIGLNIDCLSFASDSLCKDGQIKDIAISRTILHKLLKTYSSEGDIVWILDDDMDFKYLTKTDSGFCVSTLNVGDILSRYDGNVDVVIGSYSGDAPLPTLSTLRTSLLDYVYKVFLNKAERYRTDIYDIRDYYYDLSDSHIGLETPLKSYAESLDDVFSGKATSRKLFVSEISEFTPYCRGGNTIIFNRKVLDIPNISPRFGDLIARRGDYFWVEQAKKNGFKIIGSSFATLHSKIKIDFEIEKEADKLLKDLLGSSFTKTIESKHHESGEEFAKKAEALKEAINREMWDERDGIYYSQDIKFYKAERKFGNSVFHEGLAPSWHTIPYKIRFWGCFLPLTFGICDEKRAERLCAHLRDEEVFAHYGIRTLARNEKMYDLSKSSNPSNWLGAVWIVSNYLIYEGLVRYGKRELAEKLRLATCELLERNLEAHGEIFESYQPDTGEPNLHAGFLSWNLLAIQLFR